MTIDESNSKRPIDDFVEALIARLDLIGFIRRFNTPGGGKLSSMSDFVYALRLQARLSEAYDEAREIAPGGVDDFDENIRWRLEPIVVSSLLEVLPVEAAIWASNVAVLAPDDDARAPFGNVDLWIDWVMRNNREPCMICGPWGDPILEDQTLDRLMRRALRDQRLSAVASGWMSLTAE